MLCRKPHFVGALGFGCGQCLPCRINRRRVWTHRIMLESFCHSESCFLTLTYAPEYLPKDGNLQPKHLSLFLRRLRRSIPKLRYFAVGEYGDETMRPHYHLALYGCGYDLAELYKEKWGMGLIHVGDLSAESAQYIAGYIVKKIVEKKDPRMYGKVKEFSRMSLKPGIGASAVPALVEQLETPFGQQSIIDNMDVPATLLHGRKKMPLGKYLMRKIRESLSINEEVIRDEKMLRWSYENVVELRDALKGNKTQKEIYFEKTKQGALNQERRSKIKKKARFI